MSIEKCIEKYQNYLEVENGGEVVAEPSGLAVENEERKERKLPKEKIAEINEVEQLNFEDVHASRRSNVIEKLHLKRKMRHESLLKKLADDLSELNLKIEEDIAISCEEVKAHINKDKNHLSEQLKSLNIPEVASYHESVFFEIQKKSDVMKSDQLRLVQDLYEELNRMEDARAAESEKIFRSIFKDIEKNAYISLYELQYFVEHEALKMNQISLNNRRCFEDVKLKLVLGSEHTFKTFMDEVFCLREKWDRYNAQEAMDSLKRSKMKERITVLPEPEERMELKGYELIFKLTSDKCYSMVEEEEWFKNVRNVIKAIENYKETIVELFKKIKLVIRKGVSNEYDDVKKTLNSLDVLQFYVRSIQPVLFEALEEVADDMQELEKFWQDCLKNVGNTVKYTIDYLTNFGDLWTRHNSRLCESKILVLKAVEKAEEKNRLLLEDLESKLNSNLDLLRQEPNAEKVKILYDSVTNDLDAIKDRLESGYINETSILEEFYKMMNLEADILSSDIREFICTNNCCKPDDQDNSESQFVPEIAEKTFGSIIYEFLLGMNSLTIWISEFNEDLEYFSNDARENLEWRAEEWSKNKLREMSMKYQTQLDIHCKRYERVRIQVYEVRLEEIRVHEQVFEEHKVGVDDVCKTLANEIQNFYDKSLDKLDKSKIKVASTVEEVKKEEKAEIVRCIQTQMIREKSDLISDFTSKSEQVRGEIELKISLAQQSNLKFLKSIKLFHENGNYDADEAKTYVNALEMIDREISTEGKHMIKDVNKKESDIIQKVSEIFDEPIRTLSQLYQELKFNSDVKSSIALCETDFQNLQNTLESDLDFLVKQHDTMLIWNLDETTHLSEEQDTMWIVIINSIYKNIKNIFYELELPEWRDDPSNGEDNSYKVDTQVIKEEVAGWRSRVDCPIKDFTEELFDTEILTENKSVFVYTTCNKILYYLGHIQKIGCLFYKNAGNKPIIRRDLLKLNFEDFALSTVQTFRLLAAQSEQIWLKAVQNFLSLLGRVKTTFRVYFERRVREYCEKVMATLNNYHLSFTKCLIQNECNILNELQSYDNRLLPLHGYPSNKHLLDSLEEEIVLKTAKSELHWESFIKQSKDELKLLRMLYKGRHPEWLNLEDFYYKCTRFLFSDAAGDNVIKFLYSVIGKGGFVKINLGARGSFLSNSEGGIANTRDNQNFKCLHEVLLLIDNYLSETKAIIDREITVDSAGSTFDPQMNLLQKPDNFGELMTPHVTELQDSYRQIKELINSKLNFHEEVTFEWLNKWKVNVARIMQLYTVKYAHTKEQSEQSSQSSKYKGTKCK